MFPRSSATNVVYILFRDAKCFTNRRQRANSSPNRANNIRRELCWSSAFSANVIAASLRNHVGHIIFRSANKNMARIATWPIVTMMARGKMRRDWAANTYISSAMGASGSVIFGVEKDTVAAATIIPQPRPTSICAAAPINFCPNVARPRAEFMRRGTRNIFALAINANARLILSVAHGSHRTVLHHGSVSRGWVRASSATQPRQITKTFDGVPE